jgi:hypothetical protein
MSLTQDDKVFIMQKMLSNNPANGLSAEHFRRKVGVNMKLGNSKEQLAEAVARIMGGLSDAEANRIMATTPYLAVDPANLQIGRELIDHSGTNHALNAKRNLGVARNDQAPRKGRQDIIPDGSIEEDIYDDNFFRGKAMPSAKRVIEANGGRQKPKRKNKPSEWNMFVSKLSKWPSMKNLGSDKLKAISILYKLAKRDGPESILEFENANFKSFKQFKKELEG